MMDYWK